MLPAPKAAPNTVATAVAKARRESLHQVVHHLTITVFYTVRRARGCAYVMSYVILFFIVHGLVSFACHFCDQVMLPTVNPWNSDTFRLVIDLVWLFLARGCVMCISSLLGLLIDHLLKQLVPLVFNLLRLTKLPLQG